MQTLIHMTLANELTDQDQTVRVVMPIYYVLASLPNLPRRAEGRPGYFDYPKEGQREGDLAGAITVTAPLNIR